ncbi:MAG: hypothetical protein IT282_16970 [Bacteroidetes bacterium]|nr:hypothetical protein [Bacteroidota bacterium]
MGLMGVHEATYAAALLFWYAFFEFLLKRLLRKGRQAEDRPLRSVAWNAAILFAILCVGTSAVLTPGMAALYAGFVALYALLDIPGALRGTARYGAGTLERFLLKQFLMGALLFAVWRIASPVAAHPWYASLETHFLEMFGSRTAGIRAHAALALAVATAFLFVVDGGTVIVRGILAKFPELYRRVVQSVQPGDREENVGEWIGVLERIIALTFVLTGNFTALAFVLTVKSIARFKELEQSKDFAEYYILGTSGSMIVALGAGMAVRLLFGL